MQRQRLAIARALVRRPSILIFDDSFSALDVSTDARLREAMGPATAGITKIVVAQRVSTITGADQILVLDDGHLVGSGTHTELLATCPSTARSSPPSSEQRPQHEHRPTSSATAPWRAEACAGSACRLPVLSAAKPLLLGPEHAPRCGHSERPFQSEWGLDCWP